MNYKKTKNLTAFLVFAISLTTYLITLEPTNSFWDCSEFIACAYGLEIGHAPGAPVFMLLGRLFGMLAPSTENVALFINSLSAISSALTVILLFLTVVYFAEKLVKTEQIKPNYLPVIAGFIGALSYAFSDSFWFSAVEAEVYATSSLFTALVFWAILKYTDTEERTLAFKWIILIFFILGLSVGIHLLNLLTLPAMALVVYFKHYKANVKGVLLTIALSGFMLVVFIYIIIPGIALLAAFSDRLFVNSFSLPRYSGAIFFISLFVAFIILMYRYFSQKNKVIYQVATMSFAFWLIGYSSFTILVIRSGQNPSIDINNVENIYGLVDYLNREQYPTRPLIYGNNYNSPIVDTEERYTYKYHNGRYHKDNLNAAYVYDSKTLTVFPRMASISKDHEQHYKKWVDIKGRKVNVTNRNGELETLLVPTFKDNLTFFFKYQLGYMYGRYFMWNFVGRQNDIQGRGDALHGNWLSGLDFIDDARLGKQDKLTSYYENHKSRNTYYFLPFLLGLLGIWYQYRKDKKNFWVNAVLFFFTGIAIVLYLNEVPITPRERDYVHVGSYYVFALWIGLGAFALLNSIGISKMFSKLKPIAIILIIFSVPANMLIQNFNDHNRSNRYTANAYGKNMLDSCEKNAVLVTTADNDTYPIWYLQEVEKYRPDIRNVLITFLPVDWYADQLHLDYEEKGAIPISFKGEELLMHKNQYFPVVNRIDTFMDVEKVIDFVKNESDKTKVRLSDNSHTNFIPGRKLSLRVNAKNVVQSCGYLKLQELQVPKTIEFTINKKYLGRDDLLILDMLANNNWERPIYFVYPHLVNELGLGEYLHREGMLYRLMPFTQQQMAGHAKQRALHQYKLVQEVFKWGNVENCKVFLDYTNVHTTSSFRLRQLFIETANMLSFTKEYKKAIEILDNAQQLFPPHRVPYSWFMPEMVRSYKLANANHKANKLCVDIEQDMLKRHELNKELGKNAMNSNMAQETIYIMQQLAELRN